MSLKLGINHVSNAEYHADKDFLSSSNYKTLLTDPEQFYKEKILGEKKDEKESSSFVEGSLTHSVILEPHLVTQEYAFFDGLRKSGPDFAKFLAANPGKTIISKPQKIRVDGYKAAYNKNSTAKKFLSGGRPEETICVDLNGIPTKVRCDYINSDAGYIADIKTSSYPVDVDTFKMTVRQWKYELSAALYCAVAEQFYGKKFSFYFVVIGKNELVCEVYKASEKTLQEGLIQIAKAAKIYKQCKESGVWKLDQPVSAVTKEEILEV